MLELRHVCKSYTEKKLTTSVLTDINLILPDTSLLVLKGHSGSGKTTLLNIVGALDKPSSGEFIVDGISSEGFKEREWNVYRGGHVGCVFQNYPLIEYRTVLSNIKMSCDLAGMTEDQAEKGAQWALRSLRLEHIANKYPHQISKGEAQLVAIARAVAANPDVLIADEPFTAMDAEAITEAWNFFKWFSKDHLVIVSSRDAACPYQPDRIIELANGQVIADTVFSEKARVPMAVAQAKADVPFDVAVENAKANPHAFHGADKKRKARTLSFHTTLKIAASKFKLKDNRGFSADIAGALGIIGIAIILALTTGVQNYVDKVETATLNAFPLEFDGTGYSDELSVSTSSMSNAEEGATSSLTAFINKSETNDLKSLKQYFETGNSGIQKQVNAIEYVYNITPQFYLEDTSNGPVAINPNEILSLFGTLSVISEFSSASLSLKGEVCHALPETDSLYKDSYEVLEGRWPKNDSECVMVLGKEGIISDYALYALGLLDQSTLLDAAVNLLMEEDTNAYMHADEYTYADLVGVKYKVVDPADYYVRDTTYGGWKSKKSDTAYLTQLVDEGKEITVVGVVKAMNSQTLSVLDEGINYPVSLQETLSLAASATEIVQEQLANPEIDVFSGKSFEEIENETVSNRLDDAASSIGGVVDEKASEVSGIIELTTESLAAVLGIAEDLVDKIKAIDPSAIQLDLSKIIAELQAAGFEWPDCPQPLEQDFIAAEINDAPDEAYPVMAECLKILLKNQLSDFPYLIALKDSDQILQDLAIWLQSSVTIKIDGEDTGLTPLQFTQTALQESTGQTVTIAQANAFVISYIKHAVPDYLKQVVQPVAKILGEKIAASIVSLLDPQATQLIIDNVGQLKANVLKLIDLETLSGQLLYIAGTLVKETGDSVDNNLRKLGYAEIDNPAKILVYPKSLDAKDNVIVIIEDYNVQVQAAGEPEKVITYVDPIGTVADGIMLVIKIVGLLPILLISISVIVCAVMVGVTTRLCAMLRRQEFGVMRACGAPRRVIQRLILEEAALQGFGASVFGVIVVWIICLVCDIVISSVFGIAGLIELPLLTALILIVVNTLLTVIAGIVPAIRGSRVPIAKAIAD